MISGTPLETQGSEGPRSVSGKSRFRGVDIRPCASIQDWNMEAYAIQGCQTAGSQGLQGYKATRLEGLHEYSLLKYASSLVAPSCRRICSSMDVCVHFLGEHTRAYL